MGGIVAQRKIHTCKQWKTLSPTRWQCRCGQVFQKNIVGVVRSEGFAPKSRRNMQRC